MIEKEFERAFGSFHPWRFLPWITAICEAMLIQDELPNKEEEEDCGFN